MTIHILKEVLQRIERGEEGVLCTIVESNGSTPQKPGARMFVLPDGTSIGTVGGGIFEHRVIKKAITLMQGEGRTALYRESFETGSSEDAICGGRAAVFMEYIVQSPHMLILGAGHVRRALSKIALSCGYRVSLWDDRAEYLPREKEDGLNALCCSLEDCLAQQVIFSPPPYVVVVTRGHAFDGQAISLLEGKTTAYIGVIGSRKKVAQLQHQLLNQGISSAFLNSLYTPIGLSIGAKTPSEIAISIMAEIIAVYRKSSLEKLRLWNI